VILPLPSGGVASLSAGRWSAKRRDGFTRDAIGSADLERT
jgi:hypothetical protein